MQLERRQEQRRTDIMRAVSQSSSLRNRITQAEERLAALDRDAQRLNSEVAAANLQLETFGGQRGELGLEFESATQRLAELNARIAETRQKLDELRRAESDGKRQLDSLALGICRAHGPSRLTGSGYCRARLLHRVGAPAVQVRSDYTADMRPPAFSPIFSKSKTAMNMWSRTFCATSSTSSW